MRYVDLSLAALIGVSAVTGVIALAPGGGDAASLQIARQMQLRDDLLRLLQQRGTAWLLSTPPAVVCSQLASLSNSSFRMGATLGGVSCGVPPRGGSAEANITLMLGNSEVTLVAWSVD